MEDFDVPLEVRIKHRQFVHRDVEYVSILHDGVVIVAEILPCHHHVIHSSTQFPTNFERQAPDRKLILADSKFERRL